MEPTQTNLLSRLPDEIILIILGYINSDDRAHMCSVCNKFTPLAIKVTLDTSECPWLYTGIPVYTPDPIIPDFSAPWKYKIRVADLAVLVRYGSYHEISLCGDLVKLLMDNYTDTHGSLLMKAFESGNVATMGLVMKITEHVKINAHHIIVICAYGYTAALKYIHSLGLLDRQYAQETLTRCMHLAHQEGFKTIENIIGDTRTCYGEKLDKITDVIYDVLPRYPDFTPSTLAKSERQPWHNDIIAMTLTHQDKIVWINFPDGAGVDDPTMHDEFIDYAANHLPCVHYDVLHGEADCDYEDSDDDQYMLLSRDHVTGVISKSLIHRDITSPDTIVTVLFGIAGDAPWSNIHEIIESIKAGVQILEDVFVRVNVVVFNYVDDDTIPVNLDNEKYVVYDHLNDGSLATIL